ncbi:SDR family NAD(P)-dependent oxidoreductase [Pseudonocardia acaciae]|uniref:SDR family NAD(P)-dependent oxidoreductase n=1 Tax=Pseudonocardia acaciae TaxID=551276 RepID=UPI0004905B03|nr:SDR family NAD(P)-dependent oxidoreductase [Pseudonocardia acaciae]
MPARRTVALVTGANKGIGYQVAAQLAKRGMTVLLGARNRAWGVKAAETLRAAGAGDVRPIVMDVTDPDSVGAAATHLDIHFRRLDVLVNNAATYDEAARAACTGDTRHLPSGADLDVVRAVFETNVFGVITVTNAMLPLLSRSSAPRIVNVSSGLGSLSAMSDPDGPLGKIPPSIGYIPSKTALNAVTVQYAREYRDTALLVNAADPGPCATELNPTAVRTAAAGARVAVRLATLGPDGPTGGFFNDDGPVPW